jgi:hypothetical protein
MDKAEHQAGMRQRILWAVLFLDAYDLASQQQIERRSRKLGQQQEGN